MQEKVVNHIEAEVLVSQIEMALQQQNRPHAVECATKLLEKYHKSGYDVAMLECKVAIEKIIGC